jgi:hypothetical protein
VDNGIEATCYLDGGYEEEAGSEMEKYPLLSHEVRLNAYFYKALELLSPHLLVYHV